MKKNRRKSFVLWLLVALFIAWIIRPYPAIDDAKVHPALRDLEADTDFESTSYMDGGSRAIQFTTQKGPVDVCIPHLLGERNMYRSYFFVGGLYFTDPGSIKIVGYEDSRWKLAMALSHKRWSEPSIALEIAGLTGRTSDWIAAGISALLNQH